MMMVQQKNMIELLKYIIMQHPQRHDRHDGRMMKCMVIICANQGDIKCVRWNGPMRVSTTDKLQVSAFKRVAVELLLTAIIATIRIIFATQEIFPHAAPPPPPSHAKRNSGRNDKKTLFK